MSTPSTGSLDHLDPISRYAPKAPRAHDTEAEFTAIAEEQYPSGIDSDHDALILDEIEASLRSMIEAGQSDEQLRLADVSRAAAEEIALQRVQQQMDERAAEEIASAGPPGPVRRHTDPAQRSQITNDVASVREAIRDPRTPPWLLARSLEPEAVPEPLPPLSETWPYPRTRSRTNRIFLRFGLAATGAAIVAAIALKDIPSRVIEMARGPIGEFSANAAAVFNEGKASALQTRMDTVGKASASVPQPTSRQAVANVEPEPRAVKTETVGVATEPKRETVMSRWPSPEPARNEAAAAWQKPAPSPQAIARRPAAEPDKPAPDRTLGEEEVAMLRKMGDDYISNGDFVGARAVLERAADAGDSSAAFAIASTYDPVVLVRFKVRGLEPDIVKASFWYERARELGSPEAPHRLQAMMAARAN